MTVTPLPRDPEDEQRERPPRRSPPPAPGRAPSLIDSFNYAFEGIIHVLRTQRNLRIHFLAAVLVFAGAIAVGVSRLQLIALVLAIAFVLVAEMLNTAIEGVIDVSTTSFDPNAKLAKDIAAGAVLIASITAIAIGFLVFSSAVPLYLGFWIWNWAVARKGLDHASLYIFVDILLSGFFAYAFLGERFGPWRLLGAAVILTGVYLARSGEV